jgi:hypothetical protein
LKHKPEIGDYLQVQFDYPRPSQYDYIGFVTRHRYSDDTVTLFITSGDPEKVGKEKHIDWTSQAVSLLKTEPTEEDLKAIIDLALLWNDEVMFNQACGDLKKLKEKAAEQ